ncbi:MAG: PilZ domain-containing protein [Desulfosarcina sp.]|nr:PilZ domain-containing protein [Desulfobacterales bacterium]
MKQQRSKKKSRGRNKKTAEEFERGFRRLENKEARVYSRAPCSEDTHFSANRELFRGTIKNMSQGGIYVQTKERFVVGQEVMVAGPFNENQDDVKRLGKIVWHDHGGIAIQFIRRQLPRPRR